MILLVNQPGKDLLNCGLILIGWNINAIHEVQSDRVKKRKYHHRLSRKGYIGLKEEDVKNILLLKF